jgi:hypothetical protein
VIFAERGFFSTLTGPKFMRKNHAGLEVSLGAPIRAGSLPKLFFHPLQVVADECADKMEC